MCFADRGSPWILLMAYGFLGLVAFKIGEFQLNRDRGAYDRSISGNDTPKSI